MARWASVVLIIKTLFCLYLNNVFNLICFDKRIDIIITLWIYIIKIVILMMCVNISLIDLRFWAQFDSNKKSLLLKILLL